MNPTGINGVRTNRAGPAVGFMRSPGSVAIKCLFDEDTFSEIRERALAEKTSVAEQIRQLVEWGLMAADEGVGK